MTTKKAVKAVPAVPKAPKDPAFKTVDLKLSEREFAVLFSVINSGQVSVTLDVAPLVIQVQEKIKIAGLSAGVLKIQ